MFGYDGWPLWRSSEKHRYFTPPQTPAARDVAETFAMQKRIRHTLRILGLNAYFMIAIACFHHATAWPINVKKQRGDLRHAGSPQLAED